MNRLIVALLVSLPFAAAFYGLWRFGRWCDRREREIRAKIARSQKSWDRLLHPPPPLSVHQRVAILAARKRNARQMHIRDIPRRGEP